MEVDTESENFVYKIAVVCVLLIVIYFFRDTLIKRPYKKYSAWILHKIAEAIKEGFKKDKIKLFQFVQQYQKELNRDITVLEIGAGDSPNLAYLPQNTKLVCLEPNPFFHDYANENIKKQDNVVSTEIVQGYAEDMPFEDEKFDVVVSTLVLCSVTDMKKCLAEIKRVLKPGGKFVFLEHVAFEDKSTWAYTSQVVMNPVHRALYDGCRTTCDTGVYIKAAGFSHVSFETFRHKPFPIWLQPCISGAATK